MLFIQTLLTVRDIAVSRRFYKRMFLRKVRGNRAITGGNAFRHSSGIHQDGILKGRNNYEIISPEAVGAADHQFVLTARSGRHAVRHVLEQAGVVVHEQKFETFFQRFLALADIRKDVGTEELLGFMN